MISIDGQLFDPASAHFSLDPYHRIVDMKELAKLRSFPNLKSAGFCDTALDDSGLEFVTGVLTIESLDLQWTQVTNEGLRFLERLPNLKSLRLKGNEQLSNDCIPHLLKLKQLVDLQVHETSIDQHGLDQLVAMDWLQDICIDVWGGNYSFDGLLGLSARMPQCAILAKGRGEFWQGQFSGTWDA